MLYHIFFPLHSLFGGFNVFRPSQLRLDPISGTAHMIPSTWRESRLLST